MLLEDYSDPTASDYQKYFEDINFQIITDRFKDFFERRLAQKQTMDDIQDEINRAMILALHKIKP